MGSDQKSYAAINSNNMKQIKHYFSLIKFSHTIFALPFALIGFFLGYQKVHIDPSFSLQRVVYQFFLVMGCMVSARSAAMAFNRYLDKEFDARNPRTAIREIPSGIIQANHALVFTILSSLVFVVCSWAINSLCFYLSFVALFVILFYSYTKRFTALCHLVLGLGLSLAPIGAYLAMTGTFHLVPLLFSLLVLCWVSGFDIMYALQDEDFDKSNQLHSIPVALGKERALRVSEWLHGLAALAVMVAGIYGSFGLYYWIGSVLFVGMLVYQHSIVSPTDLSKINIAFMTSNGIASVVFSIFVLTDLIFNQ